jgi:hypothetical protein
MLGPYVWRRLWSVAVRLAVRGLAWEMDEAARAGHDRMAWRVGLALGGLREIDKQIRWLNYRD